MWSTFLPCCCGSLRPKHVCLCATASIRLVGYIGRIDTHGSNSSKTLRSETTRNGLCASCCSKSNNNDKQSSHNRGVVKSSSRISSILSSWGHLQVATKQHLVQDDVSFYQTWPFSSAAVTAAAAVGHVCCHPTYCRSSHSQVNQQQRCWWKQQKQNGRIKHLLCRLYQQQAEQSTRSVEQQQQQREIYRWCGAEETEDQQQQQWEIDREYGTQERKQQQPPQQQRLDVNVSQPQQCRSLQMQPPRANDTRSQIHGEDNKAAGDGVKQTVRSNDGGKNVHEEPTQLERHHSMLRTVILSTQTCGQRHGVRLVFSSVALSFAQPALSSSIHSFPASLKDIMFNWCPPCVWCTTMSCGLSSISFFSSLTNFLSSSPPSYRSPCLSSIDVLRSLLDLSVLSLCRTTTTSAASYGPLRPPWTLCKPVLVASEVSFSTPARSAAAAITIWKRPREIAHHSSYRSSTSGNSTGRHADCSGRRSSSSHSKNIEGADSSRNTHRSINSRSCSTSSRCCSSIRERSNSSVKCTTAGNPTSSGTQSNSDSESYSTNSRSCSSTYHHECKGLGLQPLIRRSSQRHVHHLHPIVSLFTSIFRWTPQQLQQQYGGVLTPLQRQEWQHPSTSVKNDFVYSVQKQLQKSDGTKQQQQHQKLQKQHRSQRQGVLLSQPYTLPEEVQQLEPWKPMHRQQSWGGSVATQGFIEGLLPAGGCIRMHVRWKKKRGRKERVTPTAEQEATKSKIPPVRLEDRLVAEPPAAMARTLRREMARATAGWKTKRMFNYRNRYRLRRLVGLTHDVDDEENERTRVFGPGSTTTGDSQGSSTRGASTSRSRRIVGRAFVTPLTRLQHQATLPRTPRRTTKALAHMPPASGDVNFSVFAIA